MDSVNEFPFGVDSGTDSDEDEYFPGDDESDKSVISTDDSDVDEGTADCKTNGKGSRKKKNKKRVMKTSSNDQDDSDGGGEIEEADVVDEKKKSDSLWQAFMEDSSTSMQTKKRDVSSITYTRIPQSVNITGVSNGSQDANGATSMNATDGKTTDFTGKIVSVSKVTSPVSKDSPTSTKSTGLSIKNGLLVSEGRGLQAAPKSNGPSWKRVTEGPDRTGGSGLAGLLGSVISKKQKTTTLESSKHDWNAFKEKEGVTDDYQSFSKGKAGYVERQEFLKRTDFRQFEVERNLRMNRRNR